MTDLNEVLEKLAQERAEYPAFLEAVDADLKLERQKRLAVRQGSIMNLVAEARVLGASKRAIMRAYGTKDFATIARILNSMEEQVKLMQAEQVASTVEAKTDWFEIISEDLLYIGDFAYEVTELEGEEYLLIQTEGGSTEFDGLVLSAASEAAHGVLYSAIKEKRTTS